MDKLKFIHNTIIYWIDKTDSKANIILGINFFIVGYFLSLLENFTLGWNWKTIVFVFFLGSSAIVFSYIVKIIYPKLSTEEPSSLIYFKNIFEKYGNNKKQGVKDLSNFKNDDFKKDLSNQIISLSIVAESKYSDLRIVIKGLIIEFILLFIFKIL